MRNPFTTRSFQSMFFFTFIMFSTLLIVLLGVTSHFIINEEVVKQTIRSNSNILDKINKQLESQMQGIEFDSLAISSNPNVIRYLEYEENSYERVLLNNGILDLLSRPSYIKPAIHSIQLYSTKNTSSQQINQNGVFSYQTLAKHPWYEQIQKADNGWVGAHQLDLNDGSDQASVVSFARKVLSPSSKEIGMLIINVRISFLQSIIATQDDIANRMILDTQYRLVTAELADQAALDEFQQFRTTIIEILQKSAVPNAVTTLNQKQLLIWTNQNLTQWTIMDVVSWNKITKASRRIFTFIVIAGGFCFLLSVALAFLLSRQFAKPLYKLIRSMNQIKSGSLDIQVKNEYSNEFGNLYDNFNHMIARIKQLLNEVNEQNHKKREAEIQTLQSHINPHFIYNTLDIINWRAISQDSHEISHMLNLLGRMLRISLSGGSMFIPVKLEFEHVRCYLELQQIHYKNKIAYEVDIAESLYPVLIPKLIIQPFVENALIHGFNTINQGKIELLGIETEQDILFIIRDNGKGFSMQNWRHSNKRGIGIRNVQERIQLYYGAAYGIDISGEPGKGTTVTIRLPRLANPKEIRWEPDDTKD